MRSIFAALVITCFLGGPISAQNSSIFHSSFSQKQLPLAQNGWAINAGGHNHDNANDIVLDKEGNIYITGSFRDTIKFGNVELISRGVDDIFLVKYNSSRNVEWAKQAGGKDYDYAESIAMDSMGNILVIGAFSDTVLFDTINIVSSGGRDVFIAKYQLDGTLDWAKRAGGNDWEIGYDIAADKDGNVCITGQFGFTATFDSIVLTARVEHDIFIAKYNTKGYICWAKRAGGNNVVDYGFGISTDIAGDIYVTGVFNGDADFGHIQLKSVGPFTDKDIFIAKYKSNGEIEWAKRAGGEYDDFSAAIDHDMNGNTYIVGSYAKASFDTVTLSDNGGFLAKYNINGNLEWVSRFGCTIYEKPQGKAVTVDMQGSVYVAGNFKGQGEYGSRVFTSKGDQDIFMAKFLPDGSLVWATQGGGIYEDEAHDLALDNNANMYITGFFQDTANFGGDNLISNGNRDIFIWQIGWQNEVAPEIAPIDKIALVQVVPNPITQYARIKIQLVNAEHVQLITVDVLGRTMSVLYDGELLSGSHEIELITSQLPSGSYSLVLTTPNGRSVARFIVQ